jgi:tRNA(Leu) C34 or U34 (ribose-2'-O)-methylase TrmL
MFSQKKFMSLPYQQQHKKLSEMLRKIYHRLINKEDVRGDIHDYNTVAAWIDISPLICDYYSISDRYHMHAREGQVFLREHNLLPIVSHHDKTSYDENSALSYSIYLDNLRSAHNVGSIIRTIEAFSLGTLHLSPSTHGPENLQVRNTAMGSSEWISCSYDSLDTLPRPLIALETSPDAIPLYDFIFPKRCTLAVGNEEYGCSPETLAQADYIVEIPLHGRKNSLNVANSFAIAASWIRGQQHCSSSL